MKTFALFSAFLGIAALGYALFWFANKGILLNYHPALADTHWLLRYFIPVAVADARVPIACIFVSLRYPKARTFWISTGLIFLIAAIIFQEIIMAGSILQAIQ